MKKIIATLLLISVFSLSACVTPENGTEEEREREKTDITQEQLSLPKAYAGTFSAWKEEQLSYTPAVPEYKGNIDENVQIDPNFYISKKVKEILNQYGFAIDGSSYYAEFFPIYEENRYNQAPNFITADTALHTYHLFFNYLLEDLEKKELFDAALAFSSKMIEISTRQHEELQNTDYEGAALRNIAYFSVAKKLLDPNWEVPALVSEKVNAELSLIKGASGIEYSNILGTPEDQLKEDYTQYSPRGHYTKSENLKKYFNALMWYGRLTFRLKNIDETRSALLIVTALKQDQDALKLWDTLYEPINFFVGEPDDLSYYEYSFAIDEVYGKNYETEAVLNTENFENFVSKAKMLPNPKINSMPIFAPSFIPNDRDEEVKGFRVLGQRSTVDAMIFQKLIYRDVEENNKGEYRMLPKALDIPAVFGSKEAYDILLNEGETEYKNYKENFKEMQDFVNNLTIEDWGKNLYWGWNYCLRALLAEYGEGYPSFMRNEAWKLKELVTFLASWTELKHDTILYAKQVYAELGGGPFEEEYDDRGYVEPNPELYNRLKSLVNLTSEGLAHRDLLSDHNKKQLERLEEMMKILRDISIKELENKTLSDEEYDFIRTYGGSLEHFFYETLSEEDKNKELNELLNANPTAIVADVATDPNGFVLEQGVGPVNKIYVIFPIDGKLRVGAGGAFSHYEFIWPMDDRLTDEKWKQILFPYSDPSYEMDPIDFKPEIADWQTKFTIPQDSYY